MAYDVQQADLDILKQSNKQIYCKLGLLNSSMQTTDSIEGQLISDSYSIDADSDIRRTMTLEMVVKDKIFTYTRTNSFWLDKYIDVYVGYLHQRTQEIYWYPLGIYMISTSEYTFENENSNLSLSLVDLMAKLTGLRAGTLQGTETIIEVDNDVRDVVVSTITDLGGFSEYRIEDPDMTIPYEIDLGTGSTVYNLLAELRDLNMQWEIFFDTDGTFIFQEIPQCIEDDAILDNSVFTPLIISETLSRTDNEVRNHIIVYGAAIDADYYSDTTTLSDSTYSLTVDSYTSDYTNGDTFCFMPDVTNPANAKINVNSIGAYAIMNTVDGVDEVLETGLLSTDTYYVVEWDSSNSYFLYQGQFQIQGEAKDTDEDSPFNIATLGDVVSVLSGDDYEDITTDELALERAEYELWKATRFNETVTLKCIAIPFLDVNKKITYTSLNTGEEMNLITKKISGSMVDGIQTIECIHWYPLYPFST